MYMTHLNEHTQKPIEFGAFRYFRRSNFDIKYILNQFYIKLIKTIN